MMKLAIMQPYFMPYLGYFALIKHSDEFILFDTPQFIRHGWIERNQIVKPQGESLYIKVPLNKFPRETAIKDVTIRKSENWKAKIMAQLTPYKKKAPYYNAVLELINTVFELQTESIVELNYFALQNICKYLDIETPIHIWSQMNIEIGSVTEADEWALQICKAMKAQTYVNPTGGMSFFDRDKYKDADIELKFLEFIPSEYQQLNDNFVPFMSIIDVMMFCNKEDINSMLDNVTMLD